jgi:hypothetical protein
MFFEGKRNSQDSWDEDYVKLDPLLASGDIITSNYELNAFM